MNRTFSLLLTCAAFLAIVTAHGTFAQEESSLNLFYLVKPLVGIDNLTVQAESDAGVGLKVWTYNAVSTRQGSKGQKFTGIMVGDSPLTSKTTTTTTVQIIPVVVKIGDTTFDPTKPSPCAAGKVPLTLMQQSPLVLAADFTMNGVAIGKTQYTDAFQRANFWQSVSKNGGTFHNNLKVVTLKPITVAPGAQYSKILQQTKCGPIGEVDIQYFDNLLETKIIPSLKAQGVNATTFPAFMTYEVVWNLADECCAGGYHAAYGNPPQTYGAFMFDLTGAHGVESEDSDIPSHEIAEWMDDPTGNNPTPAWGRIGQVTKCQDNLEVADPLTHKNIPVVKMPNGYTYHLQELAFYSWFYGPPSIGAGGKFSDNGTFTSAQGLCK
jgi:hypothetical protein